MTNISRGQAHATCLFLRVLKNKSWGDTGGKGFVRLRPEIIIILLFFFSSHLQVWCIGFTFSELLKQDAENNFHGSALEW